MSTKHPKVSRRRFMRGAAVAAAAPTVFAGATVTAAPADVNVAATVVRASHSKTDPGALRIGVRASVLAGDLARDNIVVVVEPVRFGAPSDETRDLISKQVQRRIAEILTERGTTIAPDHIAVQVFGGVL